MMILGSFGRNMPITLSYDANLPVSGGGYETRYAKMSGYLLGQLSVFVFST